MHHFILLKPTFRNLIGFETVFVAAIHDKLQLASHSHNTCRQRTKAPAPEPSLARLLCFFERVQSEELITVPLSHVPKIGTSLRHTTTQLTLCSVGSMSQFNARQLHILGTCGE